MKKLRLTCDLEYDAEVMHGGDANAEAKAWFMGLLMGGTLVLHENDEIGDAIGEVRVISVEDTPSGV